MRRGGYNGPPRGNPYAQKGGAAAGSNRFVMLFMFSVTCPTDPARPVSLRARSQEMFLLYWRRDLAWLVAQAFEAVIQR